MKTKTLFTICLLLLGAMAVQAQELTSFKAENGKYGYKDKNEKVVIAPKYDFATFAFDDGLAQVRLDGKHGFIDKSGKEIIPLQYKNTYSFSEGLAAVQRADNQWIYIDKTNKAVITLPDYINVSGITAFTEDMLFSEGLAPVKVHLLPYEENLNDVSNPEVVERIKKELNISAPFTEADEKKLRDYLTPLKKQALQDPYRYSYVDKTGKLLLDPFKGYHTAKRFSEGLAAVGNYVPGTTYMTMEPKYRIGYIDKTGKLVVALKYEDARPFSESLAAVKLNGLWGFVSKEGKEVVQPQIGRVDDFKNGYAVVAHGKIEQGKPFNAYDKGAVWGIIGKDGKAVVPIVNYSVSLNQDGIVTTVNGSLETKVHISAYEEFNKGHIAAQQKQYEQAAKHFRLSADKGYGAAMGNLGILYASGTGVEKSPEKGLEWMQKGAENNDLHSMLNLGLHYAQNQPQDFSKAFQWFKKASDNNYAQTMGHLALLYATGQGTPQNGAEAKKWLDTGVALGDAHCMFNYGLLYFQGVPGFAKDPGQARQWFNKAELAGHPQAKAALAELSKLGH